MSNSENTESKTPPRRPFIAASVNKENVINELAYHEAAHFVLRRLVQKLGLDFPVTQWICVTVQENEKVILDGMVNYTYDIAGNSFDFAIDNDNKRFAKLFITGVGYCSYQFLKKIEPNSFFISLYERDQNWENGDLTMHYYTLKGAMQSNRVGDIREILRILEQDFQIQGFNPKKEIIISFFKIIGEILALEPVWNAIEHTKNQLIKSKIDIKEGMLWRFYNRSSARINIEELNGEYYEIKGENLEQLKEEVDKIMKAISLEEYVQRLAKIISPG